MWYWYKDQWNIIESPEINPDTYGKFIFDNRGKNIKLEKFSSASCWEIWTDMLKSMKLEHILTPCTKVILIFLKDLNIRHDTIKLLEDNIGKTCSYINCKIFYYVILLRQKL